MAEDEMQTLAELRALGARLCIRIAQTLQINLSPAPVVDAKARIASRDRPIAAGMSDQTSAPVRRAPDPDQVAGGGVQAAGHALLDGRQVANDERDQVAGHARRRVEGPPVPPRTCGNVATIGL